MNPVSIAFLVAFVLAFGYICYITWRSSQTMDDNMDVMEEILVAAKGIHQCQIRIAKAAETTIQRNSPQTRNVRKPQQHNNKTSRVEQKKV